jgi:hypothetical protein
MQGGGDDDFISILFLPSVLHWPAAIFRHCIQPLAHPGQGHQVEVTEFGDTRSLPRAGLTM